MGMPIRIERILQKSSYVENHVKRRKYPIRISVCMIQSCEQYK
jgi:hypothetical protein